MIIKNGIVVTVDDKNPEAEAIAIKNGKIIAVGLNSDIMKYQGNMTKVIDAKENLVIPGLIEGHGHFMNLGNSKLNINLLRIKNWDEAIELVKEAVAKAKPGELINGRGWHQEKWDKAPKVNFTGLPTYEELSKISPNNPVVLSHASGHSLIANKKAFELAGITKSTKDPEGGTIIRDSRGNAIGVLLETAMSALKPMYEKLNDNMDDEAVQERRIKVAKLAIKTSLENGITSFHDAGTTFNTVDLYKYLISQNELDVRLYVMLRETLENLEDKMADYNMIGYGNNFLTVRSIKRSIDGALGPHGAWLIEPYSDAEEAKLKVPTGLNTTPIQEMKDVAKFAIENGIQFNTHGIGDRANREILNIYEEAMNNNPDKKDLRWRIEHAQHLNPTEIPRFAKLGVIASMQGIHQTSDAPYVLVRLGEERSEEGAYVWRKLMDAGAIVTNGTDVPVEDISPIESFYSSVTRKSKNGLVFYEDQKMTRMEALISYTINNAYASFEENIKGSITVGKLADIVILDQNIMTIDAEKIPDTKVLYTIVNGSIKYQK